MKARVKSTGELLEVRHKDTGTEYSYVNKRYYERYKPIMDDARLDIKYQKLDTDRMINELKRRGYEIVRKED